MILHDIQYAARVLRSSPAFTIVAVLTLGIGIGATSAIFTQVNAVLWNSLSVSHPEQLRTLRWDSPALGNRAGRFSYTAYRSLRDNVHLSDLACTWAIRNAIADWGPVTFQLVTGNYFRMAGVTAVIGRTLTPDDDQMGNAAQVAVINYRLWQRVYVGDRSVLGRTITINRIPFQIIGVLPEGFAGLDPTSPREVMLPYSTLPAVGSVAPRDQNTWQNSWNTCIEVVGRVQPGISDEQVRNEGQALLNEAILVNPPRDSQDARIVVTDARQSFGPLALRRTTSEALYLLISIAGLILLITCANIAGLLLVRGRIRQKELATRLAIGAGRPRIIRQLLTESLMLSMLGGTLGIVLAYAVNPLLPDLLSEVSGRNWLNPTLTIGVNLKPDLRVIGFALALTVATGVFFGLIPALRATRLDLVAVMKQTSAAVAAGRFHFRTGKVLVSVQVALSMLLLIGAAFFIRTLGNLMSVPVGYNPDNLLFVTVDPSRSSDSFLEETLRKLETSPGVTSAAVSQWPIYNNAMPRLTVCVPGANPSENGMDIEPVTPRFFETWGVRLLRGRDFDMTRDAGRSVIVNETFAKKFFPQRDAIGEVIATGKCPGSPRTIVAVVADHLDRQRVEITPMVYLPYTLSRRTSPSTFAVRTAGDSRLLLQTIRRTMADAAANVDGDVMTGTSYKEREWRKERLIAGFSILFGVLALLISCLGIYGLLTYSVNWRTSEIGIRMALGAQRPAVVRMILLSSLIPVSAGVVAGVIAALALTRFITSILFGVSKHDPWTIGAAALVFLLSAAIAAFVPARRASRIDPMRALRYE